MASRSDKFFQKRKAKSKRDLARKKETRTERQRALIVCEGEKTEVNYLKALRTSLGLPPAQVTITGDGGSAPISVVEYGVKLFDDDNDFDFIFFVFDRDSHASYNEALRTIQSLRTQRKFIGKNIFVITSVPCFEIWFLLHLELHRTPYDEGGGKSPCGNLIAVLKTKAGFENYEKGTDGHFDLLAGRLDQAKRNAARTLEMSINDGEEPHQGNSSTYMHVLIDELEKIAKEGD